MSYKLQGDFLRKVHIAGVSLYAGVYNIGYLTKYDGLMPEIFTGNDQGSYPRPRQYNFGATLTFLKKSDDIKYKYDEKEIILIRHYCCLVSFTSCKEILDAPPVSSITNESYWKAEGDVTGYMTGINADFRNLLNTTLYFEDRSDVLF